MSDPFDHEKYRPRAFDLSNHDEVRRLLHETIGYMRVSLKHGTDAEGRRFAYEGLQAYLAQWLDGSETRAQERNQ